MPTPKKKIYYNKKEFEKALQAYQDSSALYNQSEKAKQLFIKDVNGSTMIERSKLSAQSKSITDRTKYKPIDRYFKNFNNPNILDKVKYSNEPAEEDYVVGFKKPTTKPIYQEPIINSLDSTQNKMVNDFNKGTDAIIKRNKPVVPEFQDKTQTTKVWKTKPSYDEWYKSINPDFNDTTHYDLKKAYERLPFEQLEAWRKDPDKNHLTSVGYDKKTDTYDFLKKKDHPSLKFETDWYNSNQSDAIEFRKKYDLDTTGEYYKYVPKNQPVKQQYTASKYLQLKGKPSGYVNEGNKTGRKEFKKGGWLDGLDNSSLNFKEFNNNPLVQTAKIFDPTGVSSYPDVYYAGEDFYNNPSLKNAANLGINIFGALPMIGKLAMPAKLARVAAKTTNKAAGISKGVNAAIDAAPVLRKPTEAIRDFTSKNFVQPVTNSIKGGGKSYKAEKINKINNNVDRINLTNNLSDVYSSVSSFTNKKKKADGGQLNNLNTNTIKFREGGETTNNSNPVITTTQDNTRVKVQKPNYKIIPPGTYYDPGINKGTLEKTKNLSIREKVIKDLENAVGNSTPLKLVTAPVEAGLRLMRPDKYFEGVNNDQEIKDAVLNLGLDLGSVLPATKLTKSLAKPLKNLERDLTMNAINSKPGLAVRRKIIDRIGNTSTSKNSSIFGEDLTKFKKTGILKGAEGELISNDVGDVLYSNPGTGSLRKYLKSRILNKDIVNSDSYVKYRSPDGSFSASVLFPEYSNNNIGTLGGFSFMNSNKFAAGRTAKHVSDLAKNLPGKWDIYPGSLSGDSYPMWAKIINKHNTPQYELHNMGFSGFNDLGKFTDLSKAIKKAIYTGYSDPNFNSNMKQLGILKENVAKSVADTWGKDIKELTDFDPFSKPDLMLHKKYKKGGWLDNLK